MTTIDKIKENIIVVIIIISVPIITTTALTVSWFAEKELNLTKQKYEIQIQQYLIIIDSLKNKASLKYHQSIDSDTTFNKTNVGLNNLIDLGYLVYLRSYLSTQEVSNMKDVQKNYDVALLEEDRKINAICENLKIQTHTNQTGFDILGFYEKQVIDKEQSKFFKFGRDLGAIYTIVLVLTNHNQKTDPYSLKSKTMIMEKLNQIKPFIIEQNLEDALEYYPKVTENNSEYFLEGSIEDFIAKIKQIMRNKK